MDGLRHFAQSSIDSPLFAFIEKPRRGRSADDFRFETVDISGPETYREADTAPDAETTAALEGDVSGIPASGLTAFFGQTPSSSQQLKLIRMVVKDIDGSVTLHAPRALFTELLSRMRADPWVLWLLSHRCDGFHHMKADGEYLDTYFLKSFEWMVIWTFCRDTLSTRLLFLHSGAMLPERFVVLLRQYATLLATPYVPGMAVIVSSLLEYDRRLRFYLREIISIEKRTGFTRTSYEARRVDEGFGVDELTRWSREASELRLYIVSLLRHQGNFMRFFDAIEERAEKTYNDKAMAKVHAAIPVLKMQAASFKTYATYVKDRADAQINVIFALLTHEDSVSNLKAAEASRAVAEAAKRDSSAMKTIAVMTMAFLPATFLATIFAMPALEFEQQQIVHGNAFNLYWGAAVALTTAVFLVWGLVSQRTWISERFFNHKTRGAGEKG